MTRRRTDRRQTALFTRQTAIKDPPLDLLMRAHGLPEPDTEFPFARPRRWRFDYAWPSWMLALEIEGAVFGRIVMVDGKPQRLGGRHNSGVGMREDCFKYNRAAILGWCVIRATTTMVRDGQAITEILDAFTARGWTEPTSPKEPTNV